MLGKQHCQAAMINDNSFCTISVPHRLNHHSNSSNPYEFQLNFPLGLCKFIHDFLILGHETLWGLSLQLQNGNDYFKNSFTIHAWYIHSTWYYMQHNDDGGCTYIFVYGAYIFLKPFKDPWGFKIMAIKKGLELIHVENKSTKEELQFPYVICKEC